MAKILLINPPAQHPTGKAVLAASLANRKENVLTPPLGLLYLAQPLLDAGHDVTIWDGQVQPLSRMGFLRLLASLGPDVVGLTVFTEFYPATLKVAAAVKEWNPKSWVILGGPHVTFQDIEPLQTGLVDVVVRNEGERTLPELVACLHSRGTAQLSKVLGITYREQDGDQPVIRRTPPRPFEEDLDALPLPNRDLVDLSLYKRPGILVSSRGCPHRCLYCASSALSGHRYRVRGPDRVAAEMVHLNQQLGIDHLYVADDSMTILPQRTQALCRAIKESGFAGTWHALSRVDVIDPQTIDAMTEAGCTEIFFGVESGDQAVLDSINKRIKLEEVDRAVRLATAAGLRLECFFMIGHHADTHESIRRTIDFGTRLGQDYGVPYVPFLINTPYPGTALYERAADFGVTILSREWSDYTFDHCVINTAHLNSYEIQRWYFRALVETRDFYQGLLRQTLAQGAPPASTSVPGHRPPPAVADEIMESLVNSLMLKSLISKKDFTPWLQEEDRASDGMTL